MPHNLSASLILTMRIAWVLAALAGVLTWFGYCPLFLHICPGLLAAFSLLWLALSAHRLAPRPALAALAVAVLLPVAGLLQEGALESSLPPSILPLCHLVLALAAIALAEILAAKLRKASIKQ
jgi:hypothetical protein